MMKLLTVEAARALVLERVSPLPPRTVACGQALGLILAEDVTASGDAPPFDKSVVDGYAVRAADLNEIPTRLRLGEEITAGTVATRSLAIGEAAAIMTGAPLPTGADAVVMVERTTRLGDSVTILDSVRPGQNILLRGREMRAGDVVLNQGIALSPARLGVLAGVGRVAVLVQPSPRVAIAVTGDELVEPGQPLGNGKIYNSNAPMLRALALSAGAEVEVLPSARDEPAVLRSILGRGLNADVLLVSGGVSAGTRDLVPPALSELGVEQVFHKVDIKPGKPLWFGVGPPKGAPGPRTLVFGLPGNPVSGLVGFLVFVRPALERMTGRTETLALRHGQLTTAFQHSGPRPSYVPASWSRRGDGLGAITPLPSAGSGDLRGAALADGFAAFEAGDRTYEEGEIVPFLPMS